MPTAAVAGPLFGNVWINDSADRLIKARLYAVKENVLHDALIKSPRATMFRLTDLEAVPLVRNAVLEVLRGEVRGED